MRLNRISVFIRMVLVAGVLGMAYLLGLSHQENPDQAKAKPHGASQNDSGHLTRQQALQQLANLGGGSDTDARMDLINKIVNETDAADIPFLLEQLSALKLGDDDRRRLIETLFDRLTREDPVQALALLDQYIEPAGRADWTNRIYDSMVIKDPQLALTELAQLPQGKQADALYRSVFAQWAGYHSDAPPDAAVTAAALALPVGPERTAALRGIAEGWAGWSNVPGTAQAVLDWASSLPDTDSVALQAAVLGVAKDQPQLAAQYLDKLNDASARNQAIGAIASAMSQNNPAAALNFLDQSATGTTYDNGVKALFNQLATNDPTTGATLLGNLTDPADRNLAIAQLAQNWSGTDPKDAMAWAESLPPSDGAARSSALNTVMANWANYDAKAAIAYVQDSSDPTLLLDTAPTLAQALAKTDPQGALAWASSLPSGAVQDQAVSNVLASTAQTDFPTAWTDATALPAGASRDGAMSSVLGVLAQTNPAQAAALLDQFGTDPAALSATTTVATDWAKQDWQGLTTWVDSLPAGAEYDTAVVPLIASQIAKHPSAALNMANSIGNEASRISQVKSVLRQWGKSNPVAAASAAQTVNLPANQLAALLANLAKAKPDSTVN
jgi:hypothetical protein